MTATVFSSVIADLRASVARVPDRSAFLGADEITYGLFYAKVRQWAGHFVAHGLTIGDRVAIWLPKRGEYATAIYAAMDVGAAYVPMDGSQPPDRAGKILKSAAPTVLVTDAARLAKLDPDALATVNLVVLVDGEGQAGAAGTDGQAVVPSGVLDATQAQVDAPPFEPGEEDLACLLFTSGSTGVPKGVQISYRNLHSFIGWARQEFDIDETDVFSNHAGFHFDLSTFDLFAASAVGAAVWIIRETEQREVSALIDGIERFGVTVWYSVPSILTHMVSSGAMAASSVEGLRHVLFAGEVFPMKHLRALAGLLPDGCGLYNLYGPTETNVCLYYRVRPGDLDRINPVYIGEPLPGLTAEVIGEDGQTISSEGEIGELVISGPCVTPGYFNLVEPRNNDNHMVGRHATGDLVGYENGYIYYHGRRDRMLKVNGNRVELGEIEAALAAMEAIREAAVVVDTGESSQTIAAFYSLEDGAQKPGMIAIKQHCSKLLPRYMIPNLLLVMDELPKNQNGKTDYLALAEAVRQRLADRGGETAAAS